MTTIKDLARELGVSAMTVSNVINGRHDKVSAATVERVHATMQRVGYVPNAPARALAAKRTNLLALVYHDPEPDQVRLSNPHDATFVGEVERNISASGRHLLFRVAEDVRRTAENLQTWRVDGAMLLGTFGPEVDDLIRRVQVPMVFVDNYSDSPHVYRVGIDDHEGGRLAGQHLVDTGHRDVAFVGPKIPESGVIRERYDGFRSAVSGNGIKMRRFACDSAYATGYRLGERLARATNRPDGLFVHSDISAIGLLHGVCDAGVDVPGDLSIIGFDDTPEADHTRPALTTIRQDVALKARRCVEVLDHLLDDDPSDEAPHETLGVELVKRSSVRDRR